MKRILIVLLVAMTMSFANAQKIREKDVPANVKLALQSQYPKAAKLKWAKENDKYEASFEISKVETSVLINSSGEIVETEIEIGINQLPKGVAEYIKSNYKGESIKEAAKITDANGTLTFEAEIKGKDLIFDNTGKFIKESKD